MTNNQSILPPSGGSWTAIRVTLAVDSADVLHEGLRRHHHAHAGPSRPRSTGRATSAFVLDMTGSMAYASMFNYNGNSMNPDDLVPYVRALRQRAGQPDRDGQPGQRRRRGVLAEQLHHHHAGRPADRAELLLRPGQRREPRDPGLPGDAPANLKNAFHRWSPPETGGDPTTYTPPVTYNFTGYNAFAHGTEATPMGPTPAPDTFETMTDGGGITYVGDRWRRADGSINKTDTTWATGSHDHQGARRLRSNCSATRLSGTNVHDRRRDQHCQRRPASATRSGRQHGYDLDIASIGPDARRRRWPATRPSRRLRQASRGTSLVPDADQFKGFSMGPGYWGKTFFIWPPDPLRDPNGRARASPGPSSRATGGGGSS